MAIWRSYKAAAASHGTRDGAATTAEQIPFLKWAGGKRWLVFRMRELLQRIGHIRGTYFEPFLGSGAMFFFLRPERAVLSDLNADLINVYRTIQKHPEELDRLLRSYQRRHCRELYYRTRAAVPRSSVRAAARFLYLNRTCWNGLYRVNKRGNFNVPVGTKSTVVLPTDNFKEISRLLKRVALRSTDFSEVFERAGAGDVLFADPPYTVNHNLNGFLKYNENLFSWADQERLHRAAGDAIARGARVLVSNADHRSIRKLYSEKRFRLHTVERTSKISGSNAGRKVITELLITSRNI